MKAPGCQKTVLPNGLRVLTETMPYVRSVSVGVWIETGSSKEDSAQHGVSHFVEHMTFKGTPCRTAFDIAHGLESLGGRLDALTGRDSTHYYAHVLDEHVGEAVDVLADMLSNSLFDEGALDTEREVIIEEIREVQDLPDEWLSDLFARSVWEPHPMGRSVLGRQDCIRELGRDDLLAYRAAQYNTSSVVVAAAGNIEHADFVDRVARGFRFSEARPASPMGLTDPCTLRVDHTPRDISQLHLCLGTRAYPYRDARRMPLMAIHTVLGGGMSSRLFQNIREDLGLVYSVYSYLDMLSLTGLFATYAATEPSKAEKVVRLICKELHRLMSEPLSSDELRAVKSQLKGGLLLSMEGTGNRMMRLARQESYLGDAQCIEETIAEIERLDADCLMETASILLGDKRLHLVTLGPGGLDETRVQRIIENEM